MKKHWTLDDIDWGAFDPAKVNPDILRLVKAASLVEQNGRDYATYLTNVFADDAEFQEVAGDWAEEEVQHGQAFGRWAEMADPGWSFAAALATFRAGYKLPLAAVESVRGSRTGELIARCIVETGTSSYYTALADAAVEPALRQICLKIAADEHRHYKVFYTHMKRYQERERLGIWERLKVALGRLAESEDDELSYAYYSANGTGAYDRRANRSAYARRAYSLYRARHVERAIGLVLKAVGLAPNGRLHRALAWLAGRFMGWRAAALARAGA